MGTRKKAGIDLFVQGVYIDALLKIVSCHGENLLMEQMPVSLEWLARLVERGDSITLSFPVKKGSRLFGVGADKVEIVLGFNVTKPKDESPAAFDPPYISG